MKKAVVLLAEGFEEIEALSVVDVLRRAGVECHMCSLKDEMVSGSHNISVKTDILFDHTDFNIYDALVLPGGMPGAANLRDDERVLNLVKQFYSMEKVVAAICAAPIVFAAAGVLSGKRITSHPSVQHQLEGCTYIEKAVFTENNIITSRGPATALHFAFEILNKLGLSEKSEELRKSMMLCFIENR